MGIHDLLPFLKKKLPSLFEPSYASLSTYGSSIAVDVPLYAHKYCALDGSTSRLTARFVKLAETLVLTEGLSHVIWVFDGLSKNPLKEAERASRAVAREKLAAKKQQTEGFQVLIDSQNLWPRSEDYINIQKALEQRFGSLMVFQTALYEAEFKCASLTRQGLADMVLTEDTDAIAMLSKRTILKYNPGIQHVSVKIEDVLQGLSMEPVDFQLFCLLCGNDFIPRVPFWGPETLYKDRCWFSKELGPNIDKIYEKTPSKHDEAVSEHKALYGPVWAFFQSCGSDL